MREDCVLVPMLWTPDAVAHMLATVEIRVGNTPIAATPAAPAPAPAPFDVAIGSELMYYMSDLQALCTVLGTCLEPSRGCFLSAHVFRKDGQLDEWVALIESRLKWVTYEVSLDSFIEEGELDAHPGWWNARMLVSGPASVLAPQAEAACVDAAASGRGGCEAWLDIHTKLAREREEEDDEGAAFLALMGGGGGERD